MSGFLHTIIYACPVKRWKVLIKSLFERKGEQEMEGNWCIICREYIDECNCDEEEEENWTKTLFDIKSKRALRKVPLER